MAQARACTARQHAARTHRPDAAVLLYGVRGDAWRAERGEAAAPCQGRGTGRHRCPRRWRHNAHAAAAAYDSCVRGRAAQQRTRAALPAASALLQPENRRPCPAGRRACVRVAVGGVANVLLLRLTRNIELLLRGGLAAEPDDSRRDAPGVASVGGASTSGIALASPHALSSARAAPPSSSIAQATYGALNSCHMYLIVYLMFRRASP